MQDLLLEQGLDLLVYGMGTVFVFLTLLVICVMAMSWVLGRFFAELEPESPVRPAPVQADPSAVDPQVLAVIQEAIYQHRARRS